MFFGNRNYYYSLKLWRIRTQGMDNYCNCNHGDYCHDNNSEELVHTLPIIAGDGSTVNMEMNKNILEDKVRREVRDYAILTSIVIHVNRIFTMSVKMTVLKMFH